MKGFYKALCLQNEERNFADPVLQIIWLCNVAMECGLQKIEIRSKNKWALVTFQKI
jgi:hypothetical protein